MGSSLADLDQRDVARARAELVEVIAARFAYPAFFDYQAGMSRMRPLSAARRQEITQFVQMADLGSIEQVDLTSPQVRRFLERLLRRFLELTGDAASPKARWRVTLARVDVPVVAAEIQRGLVAFAAGAPEVAEGFGLPRSRESWHGTDPGGGVLDAAHAEQSARLIQAALLPRRDPSLGRPYDADEGNGEPVAASPTPTPQPASRPTPWHGDDDVDDTAQARQWPTEPTPAVNPLGWRTPGPRAGLGDPHDVRNAVQSDLPDASAMAMPAATNGNAYVAAPSQGSENGHAATMAPTAWAAMLHDLTGPVTALPAFGVAAPASSPFQGLEGGAQSGIFGPVPENPFSEPLTGPLAAVGNGDGRDAYRDAGANGNDMGEEGGATRGLPPGLIQVYSEYLRALRPAAASPEALPDATPPATSRRMAPEPEVPTPEERVWERSTMPPAPLMGAGVRDAMGADAAVRAVASFPTAPPAASPPTGEAGTGNDQMIFAQLRNQLDAYLRVMALAAGIPAAAGQPERLMAELAHASRLSAGDERLARQILAITGRVLAGGNATPDDYRQAFMLYLLFHRGQVGV